MRVKRLEVEGGFLDGLDLEFSNGLNVLIGARGSGKTSVVELLRYCLGVPAVTEDAQKRAHAHALWVLGAGGSATLTLDIDGVERVVRRDTNQESDAALPITRALFVSQKEIEEIGLNGNGRRRILDGFKKAIDEAVGDEGQLSRQVESVAARIHEQRSELDDVVERLGQLEGVPEELDKAETEQTETQGEGTELKELQGQASRVSDDVGELAQATEALETAGDAVEEWRNELMLARDEEPDLSRVAKSTLDELQADLVAARRAIGQAINHVDDVYDSLQARSASMQAQLGSRRRELADLNTKIEALQEGAGKIARQVSSLREQEKRRQVLASRKSELEAQVASAATERTKALDDLARLTDLRFQRRRTVAESLNAQFDGEIRVEVIKAGEVGAYEAALGRALQGSGLRWRELAKQLADRMSPRELVAAIEALDTAAIVDASGVSENRARRLVSHLASRDTTELVLADIDEDVEFSLLDGQEFKDTSRLSLGQRCTVVLPLLLAQDPDLAVLDQPEDHLDNAFIVETVVDVLRGRRSDAQRIIATHNANIPVLGGANQVIVMDSSGRRAFVADVGELANPEIVTAITRLMEGGEDAFRRRAAFYGD